MTHTVMNSDFSLHTYNSTVTGQESISSHKSSLPTTRRYVERPIFTKDTLYAWTGTTGLHRTCVILSEVLVRKVTFKRNLGKHIV